VSAVDAGLCRYDDKMGLASRLGYPDPRPSGMGVVR
jgi:hypothetical protein